MRKKSQPRRRKPRDPRIAQARTKADDARLAAASPRHLTDPASLVRASAQKAAVAAWFAAAPTTNDAHGHAPKTGKSHRFFGRGVTVSFREPEPRTAPVSVHAR
jgi:hypothetical protein